MSAQREPEQRRFDDPLVVENGFSARPVHVVCPRCSGRAVSAPLLTEGARPRWWPRRLSCSACPHSAPEKSAARPHSGVVDPHFGLPLWLRAQCCGGHELWAYNEAHLDVLEDDVASRLRERHTFPGTMGVLAKLPAWLTSAKHRDEVLRTLRGLRATLG